MVKNNCAFFLSAMTILDRSSLGANDRIRPCTTSSEVEGGDRGGRGGYGGGGTKMRPVQQQRRGRVWFIDVEMGQATRGRRRFARVCVKCARACV